MKFQATEEVFLDELAAAAMAEERKVELILEMIGFETVAYLRSYIGSFARPLPGIPRRERHPGGWADISGDLEKAYSFTVEPSAAGGWTLTLMNSMEYAAALEAKDGYYVLSGVMDPGGPVERAVVHAVGRVAPGWTVVR